MNCVSVPYVELLLWHEDRFTLAFVRHHLLQQLELLGASNLVAANISRWKGWQDRPLLPLTAFCEALLCEILTRV